MKTKKIITFTLMTILALSFAFAQVSAYVTRNTIEVTNEEKLQTGILYLENGNQLMIQEQAQNEFSLNDGTVQAKSKMNLSQENINNKIMLKAQLSNGRNVEIKVMPSQASEKAIEALKLHNCRKEDNCTIELKEIGKGEEIQAAYEVKTEKEVKIFGLFKANQRVQAQISAETGELISTKVPWWNAFSIESK